jgi:hypothetical protein
VAEVKPMNTKRICKTLNALDGIDTLREHIESLIRHEVNDLLVGQLQSLMGELDDADSTIPAAERQLLARVKGRLAAAISTAKALGAVADAAAILVAKSVAKARRPIRELTAGVEASEVAEPIVVNGHG